MNKTLLFLISICLLGPGCFGGQGTDLPGADPDQIPFDTLNRPDREAFPAKTKVHVSDLASAAASCTKILATDVFAAKGGAACLSGLDKIATSSEVLAGGSFQFDQVLSELARLRDGVRILSWRNTEAHDTPLIEEQRAQVTKRLASLGKVLAPLTKVDRLDDLLENSLHADAAALQKRFLEADRREIGLLYEKMTRGVFDQGTLPQNVRIATIEHYCRVFKARILLRAQRLIEPQKIPPDNANKDVNLQPISGADVERWSAYALKGLSFIEVSLSSAKSQFKKELSAETIANNKKAVSAAYLEWTKHHESLLGK